jgi:apolipoprotein N-acyltransferase
MGWIFIILLFVCGALAAKDYIIAKKPNTKELIEKIGPYQEWIGVVAFIAGVGVTINLLWWIGVGLDYFPLMWVTRLVGGLLLTALGFLLGFALISKYVFSQGEKSAQKGLEYKDKLAKFQVKLGIAGMIVAVLAVIVFFMHTNRPFGPGS